MTTRRKLLLAPGAAMLIAPFAALAQQKGKVWRIGYLETSTRQLALENRLPAFLAGMKELGYVEGKHFVLEARFADGNTDRLAPLAGELVQLNVDVMVTSGTVASQAAQRTTGTIPIVVTVTPDPVRDGFAMSLAKPGGNLTGLSSGVAEIVQKHVELMTTWLPRITRIAVLLNPVNASHPSVTLNVQVAAAQRFGGQMLPVSASNLGELERGFAFMARSKADAVIVLADAFFREQRQHIVQLALKHRLPSSFLNIEFSDAGGLFVYASNIIDNFRRAAIFVDRILKGVKPGEIPFELPTRYQLVINRKTATALGLTIPQSILMRADRVIE